MPYSFRIFWFLHIVTNNLGSTWSLFMHGLICMCQYQSLPLGFFELFDNFVFENTHQLCLYHLLLKCINPYWSFYWSSCLCCFFLIWCWSLISVWRASFFDLLFFFQQDIDDLIHCFALKCWKFQTILPPLDYFTPEHFFICV